MNTRVDWIDSFKGILITLVVVGHALGCASHLAVDINRVSVERVCDAIYVFHMPAFFFVAGLVWHMQKSFKEFLIKKFMRLMVPYFVFGILSSLIYIVALGEFRTTITNVASDEYYNGELLNSIWDVIYALLHAGGAPNGFMFRMNSVLWFLPCMFVVELTYYWIARFVPTIGSRFCIGVILWCIACFTARFSDWLLPYGVMRLPSCLGFMIFGSCLSTALKRNMNVRKMAWATFTLALLFSGFYAVFPNPWVARIDYRWFILFKIAAMIGIGLSMFVSRFLDCRLLRELGLASMTIMLIHKFPLMFLQLKIKSLASMFAKGIVSFTVALVCVCSGTIVLCWVAHRFISAHASCLIGQRRTS